MSFINLPFTLQKSLNSNNLFNVGWKPYLTFDFVLITHQFNPSQYSREFKDREPIQDIVMKLYNKGWGYTKIHTHLRNNGFKIGKTRTTVNSIIKKMKKRDEFYHQPIMDGYRNFRVEWKDI